MNPLYATCSNCFALRVALLHTLLLLLGFIYIDTAAAQKLPRDLDKLSGSIQTTEGVPVECAEVLLVAGGHERPQTVTSTKSDTSGRFQFDREASVSERLC